MAANIIAENLHFKKKDNKSDAQTEHSEPQIETATTVKLTIQKNYAPHWKPREGVRELVQNWYDGIKERIVESESNQNNNSNVNMEELISITEDKKMSGYCAYTAVSKKNNGKILGYIQYDPSKKRLSLVNFHVKLARKILLLGFTSKLNKQHMVGQFGEGLKIGILALVRENKPVSIRTNEELWSFVLQHDKDFDENMLTVQITRDLELWNSYKEIAISHRPAPPSKTVEASDLDESITTTTVENLEKEEWLAFEKDFLFLTPPDPKQCCQTPSGSLLLEERFKHLLFVKGFFISNMKEDGLYFGVNLDNLQIDRDRRAVIHKHDIDNRVSEIWSRAIVTNNELIPIYYEMMKSDHVMMRNSAYFLTQDAVDLIANYFFTVEGANALPVKDISLLNSLPLDHSAVLIPDSLFQVLSKSKQVGALLEQFDVFNSTNIPKSSLTSKEKHVLENVVRIASKCLEYPPTLDDFAVVGHTKEVVATDAAQLGIGRDLLNIEFVHTEFNPRCSAPLTIYGKEAQGHNENTASCFCCETHILMGIIAVRGKQKSANAGMRKAYEKVMVCDVSFSIHVPADRKTGSEFDWLEFWQFE